jgi:hypothetical protein
MRNDKTELVKEYLAKAKGIAWDTCHKIYILLDDEQMALMKQYEYDPLISATEMSEREMFDTIQEWWESSCGLRFINAVQTHPTDPNEGFISIIGQFEDFCETCGEEETYCFCDDDEIQDDEEVE